MVIIMCMQQKDVLTEIYSYISSDPKPPDSNETEYALKYLEACNLLFEKGFLSHSKVSSHDRQVLLNIKAGYQFFCSWLDQIYAKGKITIILLLCSVYYVYEVKFDSL